MAQKDIGNKTPLHDLKNTDEVMKYYDEWAKSQKYNKDMDAWEYSGPKETAEVINKHQKDKNIKIFDAGCGSGLVGVELKKYGFLNERLKRIDLRISDRMIIQLKNNSDLLKENDV